MILSVWHSGVQCGGLVVLDFDFGVSDLASYGLVVPDAHLREAI